MDSLTAASYFRSLKDPVSPDLIYIDACHDTESVYQDLNAWYPLVRGKGILCGDDWSFEEVQIAVNRFAREMNMTVEECEQLLDFERLRSVPTNNVQFGSFQVSQTTP